MLRAIAPFPRSFTGAAVIACSVFVCAPVYAQSEVPDIIPPAPASGGVTIDQQDQETPTTTTGPVIDEIVVEGAQRIAPDTVLSYITLKEGDPFDGQTVNRALKALFATGLFADVTLQRQGDRLIVRVVENPIINRIAFEGNKRISDEILESEVQLRPRVVYTRTRVQNDVKRIVEIYRRSGRFAAKVEPKVIQLEQNRVDLAFEIEEGPPTGVEKISFIGNRFFSDSALLGEIQTKQTRWYNFLTSNDTYDPDRLTFDRELLRRFYLANGFADFRVESAIAELTEDREAFFITFTVDEGERYNFGTFDVISKIPEVDAEPLKELIELETGDYYDADAVEDVVLTLTDAVGDRGYAFAQVRPIVDRDAENRVINITFEIGEGPKVYVERIDIRGNIRTLDKVIRREFQLVEGDAFNSSKLRRSRDRLRGLGFFETVEVNNIPGSARDKTVVEVDVEEQSTGEFSVGAGFSSSVGALAEVSVRERNLLGRGQNLVLSAAVSQEDARYNISFTEPYFLDKEMSGGVDLFRTETDRQDASSFDLTRTGAGLRIGYGITDDLRQTLRYKFSVEDLNRVNNNASRFIRQQQGTEYISLIGHDLTYDRRNSSIDPTDGYMIRFGNDFAGVGGTVGFLRSELGAIYYQSITDNVVASLSGELGHIVGVGDDVRVTDRFFLGGDNLRGFEDGGAGPRDVATDDALGGQQRANATLEVLFPIGLPEEFGVKGAAFSDVGYLSETDDSGPEIRDTGSIRAAVGVGLAWNSPFGPVRIDLSQAVLDEEFDEKEFFRLNFGTRF